MVATVKSVTRKDFQEQMMRKVNLERYKEQVSISLEGSDVCHGP